MVKRSKESKDAIVTSQPSQKIERVRRSNESKCPIIQEPRQKVQRIMVTFGALDGYTIIDTSFYRIFSVVLSPVSEISLLNVEAMHLVLLIMPWLLWAL